MQLPEDIEAAIRNALASLEVEEKTLSEDALQLVKKRLNGDITESEFLQLARELSKKTKTKNTVE
jgi:hypothetical protein